MRGRIERRDGALILVLPTDALERTGLGPDVAIVPAGDSLVIARGDTARAGWGLAFAAMAAAGDDALLDAPLETEFDEEGWSW